MLKHVLGRWRLYGGFVSVFCFMTIVAYSQGWGAALFERTWGWETSYYASINGVLLIICGPPQCSRQVGSVITGLRRVSVTLR